MIYADNAATTELDIDAYNAMKPYLLNEYANASQPYSFSRNAKKALSEARAVIAKCINAEPDEIVFTSGGTESDNWVIKGFAVSHKNKKIITSAIEHKAILESCKFAESMGCPVEYLLPEKNGIIKPKSLFKVLDTTAGLVSIMLSNNEIGTIQPIKAYAEIAHRNGMFIHTDAVQSVGHINVDVKDLDVDFLSASAHKFNGPKGIGFLYIRKGTKINSLLSGGAQEYGMRAGTENIASIVGMSVALKKHIDNIAEDNEKLICMEKTIFDLLDKAKIDYLHNGGDNRVPGNISLSFKNAEGEMLLHRLDLMGILVSTGSACDSQNTQVSHVIKSLNIPKEYANGTIRISFGPNNIETDAEKIALAIIKILSGKNYSC